MPLACILQILSLLETLQDFSFLSASRAGAVSISTHCGPHYLDSGSPRHPARRITLDMVDSLWAFPCRSAMACVTSGACGMHVLAASRRCAAWIHRRWGLPSTWSLPQSQADWLALVPVDRNVSRGPLGDTTPDVAAPATPPRRPSVAAGSPSPRTLAGWLSHGAPSSPLRAEDSPASRRFKDWYAAQWSGLQGYSSQPAVVAVADSSDEEARHLTLCKPQEPARSHTCQISSCKGIGSLSRL